MEFITFEPVELPSGNARLYGSVGTNSTASTYAYQQKQLWVEFTNVSHDAVTLTVGGANYTLKENATLRLQDVEVFTIDGVSDNVLQSVRLLSEYKTDNVTDYVSAKNKVAPNYTTRKNYYLYDSFCRADSNTSIGVADTNSTAYTSAQASGTTVWGISGKQAYVVSGTAGRAVNVQQINESDVIVEVDFDVIDTNNGLAFRYTDINNFWYVTVQPTFMQLAKYVAGTGTTVFSTTGKTFSAPCKLTVRAQGNRIEVYVDGFLQTKQYDSFNATATQHGLYTRAENFTARWTALAVKPIGTVPFAINEDFESPLNWYWSVESPGQSYNQTFSTTYKKSGTQSFRIELHKTDPEVNGSHRCEIALPSETPLEEHWYGCSILLPDGGAEDYALDPEPEILLQFHGTPDAGEQNVSPPLGLLTKNGQWRIERFWDENRISVQTDNSFTGGFSGQDIGPYDQDKGNWVDWVFHVRWGYKAEQNPICEVYKDGVLVYEANGMPNTLNDGTGIFPKMGIYKWVWKDPNTVSTTTSRVVYYDDYFVK